MKSLKEEIPPMTNIKLSYLLKCPSVFKLDNRTSMIFKAAGVKRWSTDPLTRRTPPGGAVVYLPLFQTTLYLEKRLSFIFSIAAR